MHKFIPGDQKSAIPPARAASIPPGESSITTVRAASTPSVAAAPVGVPDTIHAKALHGDRVLHRVEVRGRAVDKRFVAIEDHSRDAKLPDLCHLVPDRNKPFVRALMKDRTRDFHADTRRALA